MLFIVIRGRGGIFLYVWYSLEFFTSFKLGLHFVFFCEISLNLLIISRHRTSIILRQVFLRLIIQKARLRLFSGIYVHMIPLLFYFGVSEFFPFDRVFLKLFCFFWSLWHLFRHCVRNLRDQWEVLHLARFKLAAASLLFLHGLLT